MFNRPFRHGDLVIYAKDKWSTCPGPRAHEVHPARWGEGYLYKVDKFWLIRESEHDGKVTLVTRRGRTHEIDTDDPRLRHASWWQRLRYRHRFPSRDLLEHDGADTHSVFHA